MPDSNEFDRDVTLGYGQNEDNAATGEFQDGLRRHKWTKALEGIQSRVPLIKRLPFNAVAAITILILFQFVAWAICGLVLHNHPNLIGTAAIAWSLGLRHALDADHISCIDLMTRRLIAAGQKPVTVGTFFSLGHSTIVIITCIVVAATSSAAAKRWDGFSHVGGIIGSSVSAAFLVLLGIMNGYILWRLIRQLRQLMQTPPGHQPELHVLTAGSGIIFRAISKVSNIVDRPWKMYPVGVLFGLGFDTSSEVALLGIASLQGSKGTSLWFILIFPFLFTSGMCLVDTMDGALMMSLYISASGSRDPFMITYYSSILTGITVVVALFIGVVQALQLADAVVTNPEGPFWEGVEKLGDSYEYIGASICGVFVVFGALAIVFYKPWRRWVEKRRMQRYLERRGADEDDAVGDVATVEQEASAAPSKNQVAVDIIPTEEQGPSGARSKD